MPVLPLIAALVSGPAVDAAVNKQMDNQTAHLIEIFQSTCMNREMKLSVSGARQTSYDTLPEGLPQGKENAGRPISSEVWLLNAPGRTYVYILKFKEIPGIIAERVCGLASDRMTFDAASDWVLAKSDWSEGQMRWPTVWNMREGYLLGATQQKRFSGLQVNWSSEALRDSILSDFAKRHSKDQP